MANAIFVSENWLKTNTPLPTNVDVKEVYPFNKLAQDKYMRDALGDALYNRLCAGLIASNLTADETALIELIRPSLAFYILFEAMPFLQTKIKNIGIVTTADDKQTNASRQDFKDLRNDVLSNAEYYMSRVKAYLCNNSSLYPEYNANNDDVNPNHGTPYFSGLHTSKRGRWKCPDVDERWIKKYWD